MLGDALRGCSVQREFVSIQYLRGIAAVAIAFKHASHPGGSLEVMLNGGVDLFFIISGFVMVASTQGRDMSPGEFAWKRCRRILPMWWLTLVFVTAIGLASDGPFLPSLFLIPSSIASGVGSISWGVGWTLVFEAVFYAYFALGLALKSERFIFMALPAAAFAGLLLGRPDDPLLNNVVHPLLLEFVMGAAVAKLILSGYRPPLALIPLALALFAWGAQFGGSGDIRWLTLGLPLAVVVAAIAPARMPEIPLLRLAGDASYSIYLLHYVPIKLAGMFIPEDSFWPITAAAGIGAGIAAFLWVERPIQRILAKSAKRRLATQ
jgi:exopolysaccharide production protein ExoZ